MCSPSRQNDPTNRRLALAAGKSRAQVDAMFQLKKAAHPVCVHIIGDRGAPQPDGMIENLAQRQAQPFQFASSQPFTRAARADAGAKQALVGVDVAHPGEQFLIE